MKGKAPALKPNFTLHCVFHKEIIYLCLFIFLATIFFRVLFYQNRADEEQKQPKNFDSFWEQEIKLDKICWHTDWSHSNILIPWLSLNSFLHLLQINTSTLVLDVWGVTTFNFCIKCPFSSELKWLSFGQSKKNKVNAFIPVCPNLTAQSRGRVDESTATGHHALWV